MNLLSLHPCRPQQWPRRDRQMSKCVGHITIYSGFLEVHAVVKIDFLDKTPNTYKKHNTLSLTGSGN
jgi:hypothetical protein